MKTTRFMVSFLLALHMPGLLAQGLMDGANQSAQPKAFAGSPPASDVRLVLAGRYAGEGYALDVAVSGRYAYVAEGTNGLAVVDVSDSANPRRVGRHQIQGSSVYGVAISGRYAYVVSGRFVPPELPQSSLEAVDISESVSPRAVGRFDVGGSITGLDLFEQYALVMVSGAPASTWGLSVIDVSTPEAPRRVGVYSTGLFGGDVAHSSGLVFVAARADGLQALDISDPANPRLVGRYTTRGEARSVALSSRHAYVGLWSADGKATVEIVDVSDTGTMQRIGAIGIGWNADRLVLADSYLYAAAGSAGLQVLDISDPSLPELAVVLPTTGSASGLAIAGDLAYLADGAGGLVILRIERSEMKPVILRQPESVSVAAGGNVTLAVLASGTEPLGYQWRRNNEKLAGATSSSLTLTNVHLADAGSYTVVVSNRVGSVISEAAVLTVVVPTPLVTREIEAKHYVPGNPVEVRLLVQPVSDTAVYALEDQVPEGWVVRELSQGGVFDAANGKIKFGPFLDAVPRVFSYFVVPPPGAAGVVTFEGVMSADGETVPVDGTQELRPAAFNLLPTISLIDQVTVPGRPVGPISFWVGDAETVPEGLTVSGHSSNPGLVSDTAIVFDGHASRRTVTVKPTAGQVGRTQITIVVSDGAQVNQATFNVLVTASPSVNDFNGGGLADVVFQHDKGWIGAWFMDGAQRVGGAFFEPDHPADVRWRVVGQADLSSDGKPDLLWQHEDGTVGVWYLDGMRSVESRLLDPSDAGNAGWRLVGTGDFNLDGQLDIVWQHEQGYVAVWYLAGTTRVGTDYLRPPDPGDAKWRVMGTGDFNGDLKPDLLWQHEEGTLGVWYLEGVKRVGSSFLDPANPGDPKWRVAAVGDYNGDGNVDVLWQYENGVLAAWYMEGVRRIVAGYLVPSDPGDAGWRVAGPWRQREEPTSQAPAGMVLIPAGTFAMGDSFGEGTPDERPVHSVYVSAFYMDQFEVTKAMWGGVYQWAITHGYNFDNAGQGKAANHPVHTVNWYDVVKWCNARSEKEGRVPAYYTSAAQTAVYRTGQVNVRNDWVKWNAGYRLPTEAEWERAARGGAAGHRFPWNDTDTIQHARANYQSYWPGGKPHYSYDLNAAEGYHPDYDEGVNPYTSPVGSFAANGYSLYDMAGNVGEWCWDGLVTDYYRSSPPTDPRGSSGASARVIRGGAWHDYAWYCRVSIRVHGWPGGGNHGFRSVLPPSQP